MPTTTEHYHHISTCIVPAKHAFWFQRNYILKPIKPQQPASQSPRACLPTNMLILPLGLGPMIQPRAQSTFRAFSHLTKTRASSSSTHITYIQIRICTTQRATRTRPAGGRVETQGGAVDAPPPLLLQT
ncbi:hypothetical protein CGRA01v4_07392 [Colletotrichum graminicola]|nr:hypothetical protein CGRA01v4_07392 [Colletotrichum graminicola]